MKKKTLTEKNIYEGYLLTLPLLAGILIFFAIPFLLVLRNSFYHGINYGEQFVGLDNYISILQNEVFHLAFGNTLKFLLLALPLIIVISYAVALMLKEHINKYQTLKSVLLLPYIMPVVGVVLLVELLFAEKGDLVPRSLLSSLISSF